LLFHVFDSSLLVLGNNGGVANKLLSDTLDLLSLSFSRVSFALLAFSQRLQVAAKLRTQRIGIAHAHKHIVAFDRFAAGMHCEMLQIGGH
jgi:hypothetical protein